MLVVPKEFANLMTTFAPLFTKRVWQHVQVLLVGAETLTAIREDIASAERGELKPAEQVFAEMQARYGIQD